jgi:uncharacterized protein (TIGR03435 family)
MFTQLDCGWRLPAVLCFVALLLSGSTISLQAQTPASASLQVAAANSPPLAYEVVSIKMHKPGDTGASTQGLPNGFRYVNMQLSSLVSEAYLGISGSKITGMPEWADSDRYDIEAKVDAETAETWKKLLAAEVSKQQQAMMRALLADRCKLKVHWEMKESPIYNLVIASAGLKMKEASTDEVSGILGGGMTTLHFTGHAVAMDGVVSLISGYAGRKTVDKTGLAGKKFDFDLTWTPDAATEPGDEGPSFFTAIEEQLGLKLTPSRGPVDTLVIDHMERPTPN